MPLIALGVFILIAIGLIYVTNKPLSKDDITLLAQDAGFSGDDLNIAVAIAITESGGDAHAYNPETAAGNPQGQGSFGLWQINLHAHPQFFSLNLYDPTQNAQAAFEVYTEAGDSFSPWSTFQSGAYKANL